MLKIHKTCKLLNVGLLPLYDMLQSMYAIRRTYGIQRLQPVFRKYCPLPSLGRTELCRGPHRFHTTGTAENPDMRRFRLYKRVFAVSLFTGTLTLAWYLKKQKGLRLKELLENFTRLPLDESLFGSKVSAYRYMGYVFPGHIVMTGVFNEIPKFQFRPDDVIVASYPKTGTTWVQEIVYMLTHNFKKSDDSSEVLETRFPYLEYPYPGIKSLADRTGPRYIKTHLPITLLPPSFENSKAKLIYITRNPRDTAVSYFHFMQLLTQCDYQGTLSSFIKMFLSDTTMYSPFFDHVLGYWRAREDPKILFVTYEELHKDPAKIIKQIAEFLEVEASDDEVNHVASCTSFASMLTNPSVNYEHWKDLGFAYKDKGRFMRIGQVGNWQTHLNQKEVAAFEEWERKNLQDSSLKFIYTLPSTECTDD
ncbi:sulfotransferase 1B1-like isoform X1 [Panulirus ornatus]|uniref:sulfotransferase 1B1-like isoform X1 n=2 Tax=Panulirus ornatus TaxID=150431 RepID=UPI003A847334